MEQELSFSERREAEEKRLRNALKGLSKEKLKVVDKFIVDASFKMVQLQDLHKVIEEEGVIEEYQNGANQTGRKVSSYVQVYNALDKSYQSQIKILLDALPKEEKKKVESDGFEEFVSRRG